MLVHYFSYVDGTIDQVATALTRATGEMSAWAAVAYEKGEALRTSITPGPHLPAKEVELEVGSPLRRSHMIIIPIVWRATGPGGMFPTMDADLVLERVGPDMVQITLRGSYKPPLKGVGRLLDRALMHRLAEASTKSFVDQLCVAVQERVDAPPDPGAAAPASDREDDPHGGPLPHRAPDGDLPAGLFRPAPQAGNP